MCVFEVRMGSVTLPERCGIYSIHLRVNVAQTAGRVEIAAHSSRRLMRKVASVALCVRI